jgi:hypothetical protein
MMDARRSSRSPAPKLFSPFLKIKESEESNLLPPSLRRRNWMELKVEFDKKKKRGMEDADDKMVLALAG